MGSTQDTRHLIFIPRYIFSCLTVNLKCFLYFIYIIEIFLNRSYCRHLAGMLSIPGHCRCVEARPLLAWPQSIIAWGLGPKARHYQRVKWFRTLGLVGGVACHPQLCCFWGACCVESRQLGHCGSPSRHASRHHTRQAAGTVELSTNQSSRHVAAVVRGALACRIFAGTALIF